MYGKNLKTKLADRANGCCEYCFCQSEFSPDPFVIDHIIPIAKGGSDDLENLAYSCQGCNNHKYISTEAIDPVSGTYVSLYHPRTHKWNEHFQWIKNYAQIFGKTPIGRATVEKLKLNREGVVNLRRVLRRYGKHPVGVTL